MGRYLGPLAGSDDDPLVVFALELRALRDRKGSAAPSVITISRDTGLARSTIYAALNGKRLPSREVLVILVAAWGGDGAEWVKKRSEVEVKLSDAGKPQLATLAASGKWRTSPKRALIRQVDYELARNIDLVSSCLNKSPQNASVRDFRKAFSADLRALYGLAGSPNVSTLSRATGFDEDKIKNYFSGKHLPGRGRTVALVLAMVAYAHEKNRDIPSHQANVLAWERKWRVTRKNGMQKIVKIKAMTKYS